jgi:hypothetical protein
MLKAWALAVGILIAAQATLAAFLYVQRLPELVASLVRCAPLLAALVATLVAPRYKLLSGILVAIPATFLEVILNLVSQAFGVQVDFPGWRGALVATEVGLIFNTIYSTLGALVGYGLASVQGKFESTSL